MTAKKYFVITTIAIATTSTGMLASVTPAKTIAEDVPEATVAAATTPSCVYMTPTSSWASVMVWNDCSIDVRVKVIWAHAPDSGCTTIHAGGHKDFNSPFITAEFDQIVNC